MNSSEKKILIVEDDPLLQKMYTDRFVKEKVKVIQAVNGHQGMLFAQKHKPDLIILDIMLPGGLNGFDLLEQLRRIPTFSKTPILIFTSLEKEKETAKKAGATEFLSKSEQSVDELLRLVKKHLF